ncbi:MBL fold metallo-hydrolase [Saccharomonospora sp. CUA-673]|uniref:N-acyl homoserine lactonase family protein n=1 Tax=Saccharomonospora sp. CUA-673 TaxID=1904969 RepID=UPI000966B54F|nr:N-acyl homoserine lactonase family protein [Saccharomonospora sp. CUA-673]OLT41669.1 MBL fold metallo-hydrolase [Saccharomonospora sp. CUA-673]
MAIGTAKRMWALPGAEFTLDTGIMVVNGQGQVTIPVPSFLIEHDRGLVLFDTGIAFEAADDAKGVYGDLADLVGLAYGPDDRLDRQIEALGYKTSDVDHVIVSHAHFDHAGGVRLFPNAELYIGEGDLPYAFWPLPAATPFFRTADFDTTRNWKWNQLSTDHDLFGDGSIVIYRMPGHTPGNTSMLVRLPNQTFLLTGDTVHLRQALTEDLPMPSDYNTLHAVRSIRRVKQLATAHDATVWISHDPEDWATLKHAPTCYE